MVKIFALFCVLSTNFQAEAQVDTINCEKYFTYFDTLFRQYIFTLWQIPPSLKESSKKDLDMIKVWVREQTNYDYIIVNMIIGPEGIPICFRFRQEIEQVIRVKLTDQLKLLRFNPASNFGRRVVSIYLIKL